jgi:hypothetical protein
MEGIPIAPCKALRYLVSSNRPSQVNLVIEPYHKTGAELHRFFTRV